jgi:ACT domain-containing protein
MNDPEAFDPDESVHAYTIRLELVDEPGELLNALRPIADNGGNLLSIFHERGNRTPRGQIPVEVDLEATPSRFEAIVEDLRAAGVTVIEAGAERYSEELTVLLVGSLLETELSETLSRLEEDAAASVTDIAVTVPGNDDGDGDGDGDGGGERPASARVRLATESGGAGEALAVVRRVAEGAGLTLVEPLAGGES